MNLAKKYQRLHNELFANHEYITDIFKLGVGDLWEEIPYAIAGKIKVIGDCEEYARTMCAKLREKGYKARLVLCLNEKKEGHLICESDGFVIDNRFKKVMTVNRIRNRHSYQFIAVSSYEPGGKWLIVKRPSSR